MRILYHHRIRSKDGQFVHMEGLITALKEQGHEIIIVGPAAVEREEFGAEAGLVGVLKRCLPRFVYELMEFAYAFFAYVRLWRAVRECHPDCLYERYNLYLPSGVWLKQQLNIPMLLEVNAPILDERKQHSGLSLVRLARWCEERTWRGADFVLPVTHVLASRIREAGVPQSKIRVIANGINRRSLETVAAREKAKRSLGLAGKLVIGFTGFMREWHGLERVLQLVSFTSNDRHLLLVGDGPARPQLEKLIHELGLESKVTITGVIGREQVLDYIAAFDIALQPGVVPYASPLKLFEYMALGSAIVAPASANIQEILTHGKNGLLFPPEDNDAFCAAVERLCEDSALRDRLSRQAKATIFEKGLTWDNNARKVVELFASLGVHDPTNAAVPV